MNQQQSEMPFHVLTNMLPFLNRFYAFLKHLVNFYYLKFFPLFGFLLPRYSSRYLVTLFSNILNLYIINSSHIVSKTLKNKSHTLCRNV